MNVRDSLLDGMRLLLNSNHIWSTKGASMGWIYCWVGHLWRDSSYQHACSFPWRCNRENQKCVYAALYRLKTIARCALSQIRAQSPFSKTSFSMMVEASCVGRCGDPTLDDSSYVEDIMKVNLIKNWMADVFHLQSRLLPLQNLCARMISSLLGE